MPTNSQTLVNEAKRLQRLQSQRRKVKATLAGIENEIKLTKRNIRALSAPRLNDADDQLPPQWKGRAK
jgi:hypothetical protein